MHKICNTLKLLLQKNAWAHCIKYFCYWKKIFFLNGDKSIRFMAWYCISPVLYLLSKCCKTNLKEKPGIRYFGLSCCLSVSMQWPRVFCKRVKTEISIIIRYIIREISLFQNSSIMYCSCCSWVVSPFSYLCFCWTIPFTISPNFCWWCLQVVSVFPFCLPP